jgi:ectoine hydroxylase-related dioxygenase (phytanoyl-CoA dioxygenase family)
MPTPGPRPADIVFDHAAAAAAVAAIDHARVVLRDVAATRAEAAATARAQFRGVYADDFETAGHAITQTSNDAARGLGALRVAIAGAAEAALLAQVGRSMEQHAWDQAQVPPVGPGPR